MTSKMVPESETSAAVGGQPPCVARVFGELRFHTDGEILALAFSAGDTLWTVEEPGLLRRWDSLSGRRLGESFLSDVETLWQFGDDARLLASGSDELSLWDVNTGHLIQSRPQPSWVTAIGFAAQAKFIATGHDDGKVRLWGLADKEPLRTFEGQRLAVSAVAFSPDGTRLACAGGSHHPDLGCGHREASLRGGHRSNPRWPSPKGDVLASAGRTPPRVWTRAKCGDVLSIPMPTGVAWRSTPMEARHGAPRMRSISAAGSRKIVGAVATQRGHLAASRMGVGWRQRRGKIHIKGLAKSPGGPGGQHRQLGLVLSPDGATRGAAWAPDRRSGRSKAVRFPARSPARPTSPAAAMAAGWRAAARTARSDLGRATGKLARSRASEAVAPNSPSTPATEPSPPPATSTACSGSGTFRTANRCW